MQNLHLRNLRKCTNPIPGPSVNPNMLCCAVQIWVEDGIFGFYRGCGTNLLRTTPAAALTFTSYEIMQRRLKAYFALRKEERALELRA